MADKKLFEDLVLGTPTSTDRFAFGKAGSSYKNITFDNFKTQLFGASGGALKQVALEIGSWNMNDTFEGAGGKSVRVESSPGVDIPWVNVRGVSSILIYNDAHTGVWEFFSDGTGTAESLPQVTVQQLSGGAASVYMKPRISSIFQTNTVFNDPNVNRGWIIINYV